MDAKDSVVDDHAQCEKVEHVGEVLPNGWCAVLPRTFQVKPIRLDLSAGSPGNVNEASDFRSLTSASTAGSLKSIPLPRGHGSTPHGLWPRKPLLKVLIIRSTNLGRLT